MPTLAAIVPAIIASRSNNAMCSHWLLISDAVRFMLGRRPPAALGELAGAAGIQRAGQEVLAHVWPLQLARIIPNGPYFLGWPQGKTPAMASA